MGLISTVVASVIAAILLKEFVAWRRWLIKHIVGFSASFYGARYRARLVEEWLADIDRAPGGDVTKLVYALALPLGGIHWRIANIWTWLRALRHREPWTVTYVRDLTEEDVLVLQRLQCEAEAERDARFGSAAFGDEGPFDDR